MIWCKIKIAVLLRRMSPLLARTGSRATSALLTLLGDKRTSG